jgi:hypothetical protein
MTVLIEVSKKWLQECFQKLYEHWWKCVTVWGNSFEKKCCVNRCTVTYFYVINRFQVLFEATCVLYQVWYNFSQIITCILKLKIWLIQLRIFTNTVI